MFDIKVLEKYKTVKDSLSAIEVIRGFYKDMWSEADEAKDNSAMDEIDERLSEIDVMQVELENTLKDYTEYLTQ